MQYAIDDIKKRVRIALEMNNEDEQLLFTEDEDTLSLNDVILSKIIPSVRWIETNAAVYLLEEGNQMTGDIHWENEDRPGIGSGYIVLPEDLMRPIVFQMSDWKRPATFITTDSPLYPLQQSKFSGVRGNIEKPIAVIAPSNLGLVLEFYSCIAGENAFIKQARYVPQPRITEFDTIDISEKLFDAVIYYIASQVATAYNNQVTSSELEAQACSLAGIPMQQPQTQDTTETR